MGDLGHNPHPQTVHAEPSGAEVSIPLEAGAIPGPVAVWLLAEFQNLGHGLRAYARLAAFQGRREQAWRLDQQAGEVKRAAAQIRPSLAR